MGYSRAWEAGYYLDKEAAVLDHLKHNMVPPKDDLYEVALWAVDQVLAGNGSAKVSTDRWVVRGKGRGAIPCAAQFVDDLYLTGVIEGIRDKEKETWEHAG